MNFFLAVYITIPNWFSAGVLTAQCWSNAVRLLLLFGRDNNLLDILRCPYSTFFVWKLLTIKFGMLIFEILIFNNELQIFMFLIFEVSNFVGINVLAIHSFLEKKRLLSSYVKSVPLISIRRHSFNENLVSINKKSNSEF